LLARVVKSMANSALPANAGTWENFATAFVTLHLEPASEPDSSHQKVRVEGIVKLPTGYAARGEAKAWAAKENAKGHVRVWVW
jgi:hypothetical protein